jgi:hypothetical protein
VIGGNVDLDLLSFSLKKIQEAWEEWRREGKLLKVNNGGEREGVATAQGGRRGPFIALPTKIAIAGHFLRSLWALEGGDSGQGLKKPPPPSLR